MSVGETSTARRGRQGGREREEGERKRRESEGAKKKTLAYYTVGNLLSRLMAKEQMASHN